MNDPLIPSKEVQASLGTIESYQKSCGRTQAVIIGIEGFWYDVTDFMEKHPGGSLLLQKVHGKDATELYRAFHMRNTLKGWKPVGKYDRDVSDKAVAAFEKLRQEFVAEGFFQTSLSWFASKVMVALALLASSILVMAMSQTITFRQALLAGGLLGLFWHQSGFIMHDLMHNEITHKRHIDRWLGMIFGSFFLGVSSHWWRDEHFQHHAFPNVVDKKNSFADPQMIEPMWVQDKLLFPLYNNTSSQQPSIFLQALISIQAYIWVPVFVFFGRILAWIHSFTYERRWYELVVQVFHNIALISLLNAFSPRWDISVLIYLCGAFVEGSLHLQLSAGHYGKPWTNMEDVLTNISWCRMLAKGLVNLSSPRWLDWYHGGLNFHLEHHLFPLMPRNRYREAHPRVKAVCEAHAIELEEVTLVEAVKKCVQTMFNATEEFNDYLVKLNEKKPSWGVKLEVMVDKCVKKIVG